MAYFDMSREELAAYRPERSEPPNFDVFWQATLDEARSYPLDARFVPVDYGLRTLDVFDVTFAGYGGQPVKGWYMRPAGVTEPLPGVVEYIGYGGGRGFPANWLYWPSAGFAYLVMDTRGQGSVWLHGDTPDLPDGANPAVPGYMTQGILSPQTYYYRRLYTDAVRAVEAIRSRDDVDRQRVAVTGISQGGGVTLAVGALVPDVAVAMPDVPFLCHFRRTVGHTDDHPYEEIVRYLATHRDHAAQVFGTLDYFDGLNFAPRIQARTLVSTALMDTICPPSSVYAAYNHMTCQRDIRVYDFNGHEGGGIHHAVEKVRFLNTIWPR